MSLNSKTEWGVALFLALVLVLSVGYVMNIVKLCYCDFAEPYRAEAIRITGVFVPPVGGVIGFVKINDGKLGGDPE